MPLHIETELIEARARRKAQADIVEKREAFMGGVPADSEAAKAHAEPLANEKRILAEFQAIEDKLEKAVLAARGASAVKSPETTQEPATGLQTPVINPS